MSFSETRFNLGYDLGTMGGPTFQNTALIHGGGKEQRIINGSQPLGRWQLGDRALTRSELDYFLEFHANRKGSYQGFRFKDWSDYKINQAIGVGDNSKTQFPLYKTYTVESYSVKRRITKPVSSGFKVFLNGTEQTSGVTVNTATGLITFSDSPDTGVEVSVSGTFDVPVRFEQDEITFRFLATDTDKAIFALEKLSIIEIRVEDDHALPLDFVPTELDLTINLGYDLGTIGGPSFSTGIVTNSGRYESQIINWNRSKRRFNVGDRTLKRSELDYFIALFRICKGSSIPFKFKDWQTELEIPARFEADSISFRFDAQDQSGEAIFYLSGLPIVQTRSVFSELLFTTTSTFEDTIAESNPPNGIYPFPITAPSSLDNYSDDQIRAYLIGAQWDNRAVLGLFSRDTLGTFSGSDFIGVGKTFNPVIIQDSLGPCYFLGTIRWEAWRLD